MDQLVKQSIRKYSFIFPLRGISKDNEKIMNRSGRFFLSRKFKDFEEALKGYFLTSKTEGFKMFSDEDLCVTLNFTFKDKRHCDAFNLPKSVCDSMNGILWKDDRQIKSGSVEVNYGDKEEIRLEVFNIT